MSSVTQHHSVSSPAVVVVVSEQQPQQLSAPPPSSVTDSSSSATAKIQVAVPYSEFSSDVEVRLGRANGNMYQRKPGVPRVHDGQVMVRLKKKRFVVLDYTIQPTTADLEYAKTCPHVEIPPGAGRITCTTTYCTKVGIPIKLYDSHPEEPVSLYLRSGLCFECQRNLNEKRRVDRKRQRPVAVNKDGSVLVPAGGGANDGGGDHNNTNTSTGAGSILYAIGPCPKKCKWQGNILQLPNDAVIVNGAPTADCKTVAAGYRYPELGIDLQHWARQGWEDTSQLLRGTYQPSQGQVTTLYEKAFESLNKAIFLLAQWKTSWDEAVEAAQQQKQPPPPLSDPAITGDPSTMLLAAATDHLGHHHHTPNHHPADSSIIPMSSAVVGGSSMASLLLAADKDHQEHAQRQQQQQQQEEAAAAQQQNHEDQYHHQHNNNGHPPPHQGDVDDDDDDDMGYHPPNAVATTENEDSYSYHLHHTAPPPHRHHQQLFHSSGTHEDKETTVPV